MAELRASNSFIETTFDSFAGSFESKLARLRYRAPALVAAILEDYGLEGPRLEVLDAGCGTGLYGIIVSPFARRHGAALLDEMSKAMTAHENRPIIAPAASYSGVNRSSTCKLHQTK